MNNCLQIMVFSCALLSAVILLQIIFCSCVVVTNSKKNGSSFSRVVGERFDLSIRPAKTAGMQTRQPKFTLMYLGIKYLKETELNEDQLVSSKVKLCFSSVFFSEEARGYQFRKLIVQTNSVIE